MAALDCSHFLRVAGRSDDGAAPMKLAREPGAPPPSITVQPIAGLMNGPLVQDTDSSSTPNHPTIVLERIPDGANLLTENHVTDCTSTPRRS